MNSTKIKFTMEDALHELGLEVNSLVKEGIFMSQIGDTLFTGGLKCCTSFNLDDIAMVKRETEIISACLMNDVS